MHISDLLNPVTQPVVNPVLKPVGCLFTRCSRLSNRLCNRFDNRLYRVNGVLDMPPKQKLSIKIENDVERRVRMIKELVLVGDGLMSVSGDNVLVW